MHIEQESDSVSRSVVVILPGLPQRAAREIVERHSGRSVLEPGGCQIQIAPQDPGVVFFFFVCQRTAGKCSRDVCRSFQVLSP